MGREPEPLAQRLGADYIGREQIYVVNRGMEPEVVSQSQR